MLRESIAVFVKAALKSEYPLDAKEDRGSLSVSGGVNYVGKRISSLTEQRRCSRASPFAARC
jgi:hypothetical protein